MKPDEWQPIFEKLSENMKIVVKKIAANEAKLNETDYHLQEVTQAHNEKLRELKMVEDRAKVFENKCDEQGERIQELDRLKENFGKISTENVFLT